MESLSGKKGWEKFKQKSKPIQKNKIEIQKKNCIRVHTVDHGMLITNNIFQKLVYEKISLIA